MNILGMIGVVLILALVGLGVYVAVVGIMDRSRIISKSQDIMRGVCPNGNSDSAAMCYGDNAIAQLGMSRAKQIIVDGSTPSDKEKVILGAVTTICVAKKCV